jgi:hypothetical protein
MCNKSLSPDDEITEIKDGYYYDINFDDENESKQSAGALSFNCYKPGYYNCVLFKIKNPNKTALFFLIDIEEVKSNNLQLPEKIEEENYLFTLQKTIDIFIQKQTGLNIYGLFPIKCALILQALISSIGEDPLYNIQVVGDASTGKSTILKYYGYFLYNHLNQSTNGLSISVPALRGTRASIRLMGRENTIITRGYLGTYLAIHIDEAAENKELIQNLKSFIHETNYSYDKAGSNGIQNKRTAHINLSENLDYSYTGQYIGMIRKAYKNLEIQIGNEEKPEGDENWDFHKPIYKYADNPYLYKVIKDKRQEFINKKIWWIDGYDYALHERFPFYFYLVNSEKAEKELVSVVKGNLLRDTIKENSELTRVLKSNNLINFFKNLKKIKTNKSSYEQLYKVDKIIKAYGIHSDSRMNSFFYKIVMISSMLNQREEINEQDYDLLRWFIEKINKKLPIHETIDYSIEGPPDLDGLNKRDNTILETTTKVKKEYTELNDLNFGDSNMDFGDLDDGAY